MDWNGIYVFLYAYQCIVPFNEHGILSWNTYPCVHSRNCFCRRYACRGILLSVWGGFKNRIFSIGLSVLVMGVSIAISGLLPTNAFFIFVICCTVMGLTSPFYGVQNALFQEQLPPEYLGRVFSLLGSVMSFAMPLGLLCSGIFAERIGVEKWFLLCGIGIIAVAVLVFVLPVLRNVDCQSQNSFARKSDD